MERIIKERSPNFNVNVLEKDINTGIEERKWRKVSILLVKHIYRFF